MRRCLLALTILLAAGCAGKTPPQGTDGKTPPQAAEAKPGVTAQVGGEGGVPAPVAVAGAVGLGIGLGALALVVLSGVAAASILSSGR